MSKPIKKTALIGGGVIGGGWAARFLLNGIDVNVFDPSDSAERSLNEMLSNARRAYSKLTMAPLLKPGKLVFLDSLEKAVQDVEFVQEGIKIFIKKSKTDQSGEGMIKAIPYFDNKNYCPVLALKHWIEFSEIKSDKIFGISDKSVALIIKKYAAQAGLDANKYGGHSLRSGFATSAAESGAEERNIMAMTGHKTTQMVRRYIKEANLFKNNALNKIKL